VAHRSWVKEIAETANVAVSAGCETSVWLRAPGAQTRLALSRAAISGNLRAPGERSVDMPIPGPVLSVVLAVTPAHDGGPARLVFAADAIGQPNGASGAPCAGSKDAAKDVQAQFTRHKKGSAAKKGYHPIGEKRDYHRKVGSTDSKVKD
jgi:hypothetical protein